MRLWMLFFVCVSLMGRELPFSWIPYEDQVRYYLDGRSYKSVAKLYRYGRRWYRVDDRVRVYNPLHGDFEWDFHLPKDFEKKRVFMGDIIEVELEKEEHCYQEPIILHNQRLSYRFHIVVKDGRVFQIIHIPQEESREELVLLPFEGIEAKKEKENFLFLTYGLSVVPQQPTKSLPLLDVEELGKLYFGYQRFSGEWEGVFETIDYENSLVEKLEKMGGPRMSYDINENAMMLIYDGRLYGASCVALLGEELEFTPVVKHFAWMSDVTEAFDAKLKGDIITSLEKNKGYWSNPSITVEGFYRGCVILRFDYGEKEPLEISAMPNYVYRLMCKMSR